LLCRGGRGSDAADDSTRVKASGRAGRSSYGCGCCTFGWQKTRGALQPPIKKSGQQSWKIRHDSSHEQNPTLFFVGSLLQMGTKFSSCPHALLRAQCGLHSVSATNGTQRVDVAVDDDDVVVLENVRAVVVADAVADVVMVAAVGMVAAPSIRVATRSVVGAEVANTPAWVHTEAQRGTEAPSFAYATYCSCHSLTVCSVPLSSATAFRSHVPVPASQ